MLLSNALSAPGDKPTLRLRVEFSDNGTVELTVESASPGLERIMNLPDGCAPEGRSAGELFAYDPQLVDEWSEFLLKSRMYRHRSPCGDAEALSKQTVQFLKPLKKWVLTTVAFDAGAGIATVTFAFPAPHAGRADFRSLADAKQARWLDNYIYGDRSWELDLASRSIYLSRSLAQSLRVAGTAAVIPIERFLASIHPDDHGRVVRWLEHIGTSDSELFSRHVLGGGDIVYFSSYALPGYDENGVLTRIIGCSNDVTDHAFALQRLSASEKRFRGIVEGSQDLFVVVSPEGRISYVSPNIRELGGYLHREVAGASAGGFFADNADRRRAMRDFSAARKGGAPTSGEYRIRRADRSVVWFLIRMSAIPDPEGRTTEVVAVCRDITEEKNRERNLQYMSLHDALTGVYNRFYFESELNRLQVEGIVDVGLVMTDLNGLKLINDAFGHQMGDDVLFEASRLLCEACGAGNAVSRVGGDEFAIFVYNCTPHDLERVCERIESACRQTSVRTIPLSISCGSAHRGDVHTHIQAVFNQAESRMYGKKLLESRSTRSQVLASLKETLKVRNVETAEHMQRMEHMVMALGKRLGLPGSEFDRLMLLASMHDIGKVAIPDHIISKPGPLSEAEWSIMRSHSEVGCRIALTAQELSGIANEICCHHERWDGGGYPYGYRREEIPLLSRIISLVDAYDVMTHKRVYKEAIGHEDAILELKRCSGTQFDPDIVSLFLDIYGSLDAREMSRLLEGGDAFTQDLHDARAAARKY